MSNPIPVPIQPEGVSPSSPPTQRARGNRGQTSYKKKQEEHRARKGAEFNRENRARIEEKCFAHLTDLSNQLSKINVERVRTVKELPVTTRGIGFAVAETFTKAAHLVPDPCTVFALYRGSLAQHELQVRMSAKNDYGLETTPRPHRQDCDKYQSLESVVLTRPKNFGPITLVINQYGNFSAFNSNYQVFIPKPFLKLWEAESRAIAKEDFQARVVNVEKVQPPRSPGNVLPPCEVEPARVYERTHYLYQEVQIVQGKGWVPDPYVVTLSNLRRTVEFLSNAASPEVYRRYFLDRNPIPGAVWNDRYVLLNPDEIMPERYTATLLKHDLDAIANWILRFKGKYAFVDGTCRFDGKGNSSQLSAQRIQGRISNEVEILAEDYFLSDNIPDTSGYAGIFALAGEYPDRCVVSENYFCDPPPIYAMRHHSNAGFIINVERMALSGMLIK